MHQIKPEYTLSFAKEMSIKTANIQTSNNLLHN